jgi:hypothetical protein
MLFPRNHVVMYHVMHCMITKIDKPALPSLETRCMVAVIAQSRPFVNTKRTSIERLVAARVQQCLGVDSVVVIRPLASGSGRISSIRKDS